MAEQNPYTSSHRLVNHGLNADPAKVFQWIKSAYLENIIIEIEIIEIILFFFIIIEQSR